MGTIPTCYHSPELEATHTVERSHHLTSFHASAILGAGIRNADIQRTKQVFRLQIANNDKGVRVSATACTPEASLYSRGKQY